MMKTSNKPLDLCATVTDWCDVQAESKDTDGDAQPKKLRRFSMVAYTGGTMDLVGWKYPVVVDLEGLKIAAKSRPILKDHNRESIVGHTDNISVSNHQLHVSGIISGAGQVAAEIITSSENGFPWQASIGAKAQKVVFISEGKAVTVNGRNFAGPIYIARKSTLGEISFVALGADDNTTARVAAGASGNNHSLDTEVIAMDFESWLTAQGFEPAELSETQTANLKAIFEDAQKRAETAKTDDPKDVTATDNSADKDDVDPIANLRAEFVTDLNRIDAIQKICGQEHRDIAAKAIAEGWNTVKTELEVLRASRPKAPAIGSSTPPCTARALEAAACLSAGIEDNDLVEEYGEKTMDAAHPLRHIGLRELVAECARLEGHDIPRVFGDGTATIRAGFSTISLSGILENVMNKTMLAAYQATPIAAFDLCAVGSVSDFKEVTRYRLLGTGGFEQVAPDGELKHGKLSEDKYTNKADTYGQILMFTRRDIINDDLNAFMEIPRQMGRSGAESIDDLFFSLLLSNPGSFFSAGNNNYLTGAETAFGPDSLTDAKTLFRKQKAGPGTKAKDKKPINIRPQMLVMPVELETEAELLMGAAQLMIDGATSETKIPTDNPHRNKYTLQLHNAL